MFKTKSEREDLQKGQSKQLESNQIVVVTMECLKSLTQHLEGKGS